MRRPGAMFVAVGVAGIGIALLAMFHGWILPQRTAVTKPVTRNMSPVIGNEGVSEFDGNELRVGLDTAMPSDTTDDTDSEVATDSAMMCDEEWAQGYWASGMRKNGKKEGMWMTYNEEGELWVETPYRDGKIDGTMVMWGLHGQRFSETEYKEGVAEGATRAWHSNGQQAFVMQNRNGQHEGEWLEWYPSGHPKVEAAFHEAKLTGRCLFYYEDGSIDVSQSGYYENGKRVSGLE